MGDSIWPRTIPSPFNSQDTLEGGPPTKRKTYICLSIYLIFINGHINRKAKLRFISTVPNTIKNIPLKGVVRIVSKLCGCLALALLVSSPICVAAAGQMNPPLSPYFGQTYEQPAQVLKLFPEPDLELVTPGLKNRKWMSTNSEMMNFLYELDASSPFVTMKTIGYSSEGREIPLLIFTKNKATKKPTVWIQGQIHGNEPAAGESLLVLAHQLATGNLGKELLNKINVIIVPRINPDGAYYFQRQTALGLDANRDHVKLELTETQAVHKAINQYKPEVIVDAHEYSVGHTTYKNVGENGAVKYHDILFLSGKNLNVPEGIRKKSDEWFGKQVFKDLEKEGFSYREYFTDSKKDSVLTLREGGPEARIGRNAYALQPSFSLLVESRGVGIGKENFVRRVASQIATHTSILKTTAKRAEEVKEMIEMAREEMTQKGKTSSENDKVIIISKSTEVQNTTLELIDIATGKVIEVPVKYFSSTKEIPVLERVRPTAYLLPPSYHHIAKKLEIQGAKVKKLTEPRELSVESYVVTDQKIDESYYEGHLLNHVTTEIKEKTVFFPKGSYVISMAQPAANLVALSLEPESIDSYVTFNYIPVNAKDEVPVYRYMKDLELDLE